MENNFINIDNRVKWQIDCDDVIKDKDCVILSSPTGSGKTGRYENWAFSKNERPIFITSPIKALSNQKFRQLQAKGYKVALETGDIKYFPYDDCDIICCTQEIYNNKYRDYENSTLVVDEFSYIFEDEFRSRVYIDSLRFSKAKNIMICSATFGNADAIKDYINNVTNREFFLFKNNMRLTTLQYKDELSLNNIKDSLVVAYSRKSCILIARMLYNNRLNKAKEVISKLSYNYDPRLKNKNEILELAKKYNVNNKELIEFATLGIVYYYGVLYPKEKLFVEELFEKRLVDTVVGTDALALGVNFPIKNVVFTQLWKNSNQKEVEISKNLFEQLSGRAGRKGFFDAGYVYYCCDFLKKTSEHKNIELDKIRLRNLYYELVNCKMDEVNISLNANIKDILNGKRTIDEEAMFVVKFSTVDKEFEEEKNKICRIVDYIKSFDVTTYYLDKKFCNLKFKNGYYNAIEDCAPRLKNKIEKLSNSLMQLQPYFEKDIGLVYLSEYSPERNCAIFIDILLDASVEVLISKYGSNLRDLLLLRKYISKLPEKYLKKYDLKLIDDKINVMDYTVLHPEKFKLSDVVNNKQIINNKRENVSYKCPPFFEKILISEKEYMKISMERDKILICDYSDNDNLKLYYIPANTMYKIVGFIKLGQGLNILNRIDINSLTYQNLNAEEKINIIKCSLKKELKKL